MSRIHPRRSIPLLFFTSVLASVCSAGIGEYDVTYEMAYAGTEPVCLLVVPDGSGPPFDQARNSFGNVEDATISLQFLDALGDPVAGYPAEDMWLESEEGGLVFCSRGTVADAATDAMGRTVFNRAPSAGRWSDSVTRVLISGSPVYDHPGLPLHFNSPDINGDLQVNLSDVVLFAEDFYGNYHFRSDLTYDLQVNLSDLVPLVQAMGAACP